jgi:hypothetical protein
MDEGLLSSEKAKVHLLVTSRPQEDIQSQITELASEDAMVPIQSDLITGDIRAYIRSRIRHDEGLQRWRSRPDIQEEIEARLMEKVDGM